MGKTPQLYKFSEIEHRLQTLEPGKTYGIWINSQEHTAFRDAYQHPAVPYLLGLSRRRAARQALRQGLDFEPIGSGKAVRQEPPPGTVVRRGSRCRVVFKPPS